jgi:hypothetical protein
MNARVGRSSDIAHSLNYAQNREKDGRILLANFTGLSATPKEQARDWMATANNYKTQCYTIVISFTPDETLMLRSMPDNGRDKVRTIIRDFLDELADRGNNVEECPYIVARHDNTDNEHYHMVIRTTDINGKRFRDKYIKKNANRAAACIAMKYGLEAPPKAVEHEKAHQEAEGKRRKEKAQRQHKPSTTQAEIDNKMRRKRAVEEAAKRKAKLKYVIEKVAKESCSEEAFVAALAAENISLCRDAKKGLCAEMTDSEGKIRRYSLAKDLGIDMSLIPDLSTRINPTSGIRHSSPLKSKPSASLSRPGINADGGAGSRNAEHEINNGFNSDDPDEDWKRRNGYKI